MPPTIPEPDEIQPLIEDWLEAHPEYAKHVDYVRYVKQGTERPADATHVLRLAATTDGESGDHEANVAIKAKFLARIFLNGLLRKY